MIKVPVPLGDRSYSIVIGPGGLTRLGVECRKLGLGPQCAVITDRHVNPLYGRTVVSSLEKSGFRPCLMEIPPGEKSKCLKTVNDCYEFLASHRIERKAFIVALGGGVVGDLAGFVAATYLRGLAFVQVPTSLLAQVDSSVGGKVGINLRAGKNLAGAFHQPRLVVCDLDTLQSLPPRELRAGLSEIIKYGVIYDAALFDLLEKKLPQMLKLERSVLGKVVARCCEIKADVVGQDETESGLRAILNFGHTIGHAIENTSGYGKYLHGEAIAIGQTAAAWISSQTLGMSGDEVRRIAALLERTGLPIEKTFTPAQLKALLAAMRLDKKVSGGEIKFVLAKRIGEVLWNQKVPESLIIESLRQKIQSAR